MGWGQTMRRWRRVTARVTINVELVHFSLGVHLLRLTSEQLVLEGSQYTRTHEVELEGESRSIYFGRLPIRLTMDVLASAAGGDGIARGGEEFKLFGYRRREIDEPTKLMSLMEAVA